MLFLTRLPVVKYKNADESTNSEAGNGGMNSDSNSDPDTTDSPPTKRHKASKQQVKKKAKEAIVRRGKKENSDDSLTSDDYVSETEPARKVDKATKEIARQKTKWKHCHTIKKTNSANPSQTRMKMPKTESTDINRTN